MLRFLKILNILDFRDHFPKKIDFFEILVVKTKNFEKPR